MTSSLQQHMTNFSVLAPLLTGLGQGLLSGPGGGRAGLAQGLQGMQQMLMQRQREEALNQLNLPDNMKGILGALGPQGQNQILSQFAISQMKKPERDIRTVGGDLVEVTPDGVDTIYDAPEEPTTKMRNAIAAGLRPGTPEFLDFMKGQPLVTVGGENPYKIPQGYMLKDPSDPSQGVAPIPGSSQDPSTPTEKQRNDVRRATTAYNGIKEGLQDYRSLVEKHGTEIIPGEGKDALIAARRTLQLQLKELFNLGVLNGPDLALMNQLMTDPTDPMVMMGNIASGSDMRERVGANITQLEGMLEKMWASQVAPTAQPDPVNKTESRLRELIAGGMSEEEAFARAIEEGL